MAKSPRSCAARRYLVAVAVPEGQRSQVERMAAEAGDRLEHASAQEILKWAVETFDQGLCLTASMGDAVLIDLVSRITSDVSTIFLDTGYHFSETLETRDRVRTKYPIRLVSVEPMQTVQRQDEVFGPRLHDRDPDACCNLRKVEPLRRSLEPYWAWASGIRRAETHTRHTIRVVEWDSLRSIVKINPMAAWSEQDVKDYIETYEVVVNPLVAQGYPSIGCAPCTRRVAPGADPRSGRWAGRGKTECGLHLGADGSMHRTSSKDES